MKIRRYWSRHAASLEHQGEPWTITCFGASDNSPEQAHSDALDRAAQILRYLRDGQRPADDYAYADRPLREEILDETVEGGRRIAALTRNASGNVVLNTADVLFADIDDPKPGFLDRIAALFRGGRKEDSETPERTRAVAERNGLRIRLYRTRGGYRALVTSRLYEPGSAKAEALLAELGSDPLYVRLCRTQESFRARLSPKAWRLGLPRPPARFPWATPAAEAAFRQWLRDYETAAAQYATCRLVEEYGTARTEPRAVSVTRMHDRHALGDGELA